LHFPVSGVDVFPAIPIIVAFVISFFTSMGGVSGAFLLLPFQVSVLGFTSPAVSPTNLVYNIVAIPSGVYRYIKEKRMAWPLALVNIAGTLPGVFIGVIFRIKYLPDPKNFKFFVGCVLFYIAARLLYDLTPKAGALKKKTNALEEKFKERSTQIRKQQQLGSASHVAIKTVRFSPIHYTFEFYGETFSFNPVILFALALAGKTGIRVGPTLMRAVAPPFAVEIPALVATTRRVIFIVRIVFGPEALQRGAGFEFIS